MGCAMMLLITSISITKSFTYCYIHVWPSFHTIRAFASSLIHFMCLIMRRQTLHLVYKLMLYTLVIRSRSMRGSKILKLSEFFFVFCFKYTLKNIFFILYFLSFAHLKPKNLVRPWLLYLFKQTHQLII